MSIGAGTLATPGSQFGRTENDKSLALTKTLNFAASHNGKQHNLPSNASHTYTKFDKSSSRFKWEDQEHFLNSDTTCRESAHPKLSRLDVEKHWDLKQPKGPTRVYGAIKPTKYGGEERLDGPDHWTKGEYWNIDSSIKIWGDHEVRRNAAAASHDVHRQDQVQRMILEPRKGALNRNTGKPILPRQCTSGAVTADACFLEAQGFDLGNRDRSGKVVRGLWKPVSEAQMFRSTRSFDRNIPRITDHIRTMCKTKSCPLGATLAPDVLAVTLQPEDLGGDAGALAEKADLSYKTFGRTHASRSCNYWNAFDHTVAREAAKMNISTFTPSMNKHLEGIPFRGNLELTPAAVYTLNYRKFGEAAFREHSSSESRPQSSRPRPWLAGTKRMVGVQGDDAKADPQ